MSNKDWLKKRDEAKDMVEKHLDSIRASGGVPRFEVDVSLFDKVYDLETEGLKNEWISERTCISGKDVIK